MHKGLLAIITAAVALTVAFPSFVVEVGYAASGGSRNVCTVTVIGDTAFQPARSSS